MSDLVKYDYKTLTPFKWFVLENFPFIEADFDAITNYQLYCKVVEYLNKTIDSMNQTGEVVEEFTQKFIDLQNYVDNYFNNLDVQEEINNKLDNLVKDGTLEELIGKYINPYFTEFNNKIDTQNQKINEQNNKIQTIASGSPAGTYNTLEDLESANPNHSRIYLVVSTGNWYYYNETLNQWESGGKYIDNTNFTESIRDLIITKNQFKYNVQNLFSQLEWYEKKSFTDSIAAKTTLSNYESLMIDSEYTRISKPVRVRYDNGVAIFNNNNWKWFKKGNTTSLAICYDVNGNYSGLIMGNSENIETLPEDCYYLIFKQYYSSSNFVLLLPFNVDYFNNHIENLTPDYFLKYADGNIFNKLSWTDGKNLNFFSSLIQNMSIFFIDKFLIDSSVSSYSEPLRLKDLNGNNIFSETDFKWNNIETEAYLGALFDEYGNYIKSLTKNDLTFTDNSYYIIFIKYSNINNYVTINPINVTWLNPIEKEEIYYVGATRENKSFTDLIKSLKDNWKQKTIYIYSGTYDIFQEIGGKNYVDSIIGKTDWSEVSTIIPPNTKIIGIGKVIFNFLPNDNEMDASVGGLLSPINTRGGVQIENITINATNCRYCIHDEVSLLTDYDGLAHVYKNVIANYIKGNVKVSPSGQAFGCGFNSNTNFLFENCTFTTTHPNTPAWSMHDRNSYGNNGSTIICNNCIFLSNYNISASLRNIHQQETITEINTNMNNCYFKTNINIKNDLENRINNNFNLTLLNCNVNNVVVDENLNNSFVPKIYK